MNLEGKDIVSVFDFSKKDFYRLFQKAEGLREKLRKRPLSTSEGKVLTTVFFEPSTRTRLSFSYAMLKLGGKVVDFGSVAATSVAKGESLTDTIRMIDGYGTDVIVLRHGLEGASRRAAEVAEAPVINAGDGSREHPTQALLDLYTVWKIFGKVDGLRVGIIGDLKYGRTPSSLSYALSMFDDVQIRFIAPEILQVREEVKKRIRSKVDFILYKDPREAIRDLDILYVTRIQRERFEHEHEYHRVKGIYKIDKKLLEEAEAKPIILHPLPRVDEISPEIDGLPNARYFEQASNGVFVRAALIGEILGLET
ncbi:MAG: aspartate carbamoyltransferase [Nitrososphaeria archaeon]|nr:aspartate carbamoyltransferase [Nitrososphaeria archaeon]NIN52111.1 aspartate carbamoyltransferase [Nitrososphaeria archaeon]NIQ32573.1 aspartate carbamoyltransferase [Nitrososphaeria archaeon]